MRILLVTTICALTMLLVAPVAGAAPGPHGGQAVSRAAATACAAQRSALGPDGFRRATAMHTAREAWRRCVRVEAVEATIEARDATERCRTAQQVDPDAFGEAHRGGVSRCVADAVRDEARADAQDTHAAARACRGERAVDLEAFTTKYAPGTGHDMGRRAFLRCVTATSQGLDHEGSDLAARRHGVASVTGTASAI